MERSRSNIIAFIDELIPVANAANANIERTLTPNTRNISAVHKLQDRLIQLCGPILLDQVKPVIINPALARPNVSDSTSTRRAALQAYNMAKVHVNY